VALANFLVEDKMVLLQDTSGIAQGIQTAGTALAKALQEGSKQARIQKILKPQQVTEQNQSDVDIPNLAEIPEFRQKFEDMLQQKQDETGEVIHAPEEVAMWEDYVGKAQTLLEKTLTPQQVQKDQKSQEGMSPLSPKVMALAQEDPQLAKMYQSGELAQQQMAQKEKLAQQRFNFDQANEAERRSQFGHAQTKEYRGGIERTSNSYKAQTLSLDTMENAINSGDLGPWSKDFLTDVLAESTGIEAFRNLKSPKGSQFLSAQKALYSDLRELFPGQIRTAELTLFGQFLPQLGRSKEANQAVFGMLKALHEMKGKKIEAYNKITSQYGGFTPINISALVENELKEPAKQIMDNYKKNYLFARGNTFKTLPQAPPEGAIFTKNGKRYVYRNGKYITKESK
jgi:hypothetical protein